MMVNKQTKVTRNINFEAGLIGTDITIIYKSEE